MSKVDLVFDESEKAFADEWERTDRLRNLAEKLVAAVAVVVGFQLVELDSLALGRAATVRAWLAIGALSALGVSLVLAFLSMQVGRFRGRPRGSTLIDELKDEGVTEATARIKVAKMYLEAHEINAGINDRRARLLMGSGALLVAGFLLAVGSYVMGQMG